MAHLLCSRWDIIIGSDLVYNSAGARLAAATAQQAAFTAVQTLIVWPCFTMREEVTLCMCNCRQ
jgi:hypothetical protein